MITDQLKFSNSNTPFVCNQFIIRNWYCTFEVQSGAIALLVANYFEQNNFLLERQYGYRRKRSAELATANLIDEIRKAAKKRLITGALFVKLPKVFDTPGHSKLITKVQNYGIKGQDFQWFTSYLFACHQDVNFKNKTDKFPNM